MKRKESLKLIVGVSLVAVLAISLFLAGGCVPKPTAPTPGEPTPGAELPIYHWRIQTPHPPMQTQDFVRPWLDDLEEALGGRVEFEVYSTGELMPQDQVLDAVRAGTLDMATGLAPDWAAPIDIADFDWAPPFAWENLMELEVLYKEKGLEELFAESYEELGGIKYLGMLPCDPVHLLSSRPIQSYEDLDGLKINTYAVTAAIFADAGATSVMLPFEEFYLGGQTGMIEGLIWCGAKEGYSNSWHEVFPYLLTNPINGTCNIHAVINSELWDSLPSDMQATLSLTVESLGRRMATYYYDGEAVGRR